MGSGLNRGPSATGSGAFETPASPYFWEQGSGPGVVCLHSNASTSSQWRSLAETLGDGFHVLAVDGIGAGKSPDWTAGATASLAAEVEMIEGVLQRAGTPLHLVGHSYGAAVAIKTALMHPQRVRSLVLYEPTLFHLVAGDDPQTSPAEGIWHAATDAAEAVDRGDGRAGAERFIDYWMGDGSWVAMLPNRQAGIAHATRHVRRWRDALFQESVPRDAIAALDLPVLLMSGKASREAALSVARVLAATLRRVTFASQPGLGHMGPVTHPAQINRQIANFLSRH